MGAGEGGAGEREGEALSADLGRGGRYTRCITFVFTYRGNNENDNDDYGEQYQDQFYVAGLLTRLKLTHDRRRVSTPSANIF